MNMHPASPKVPTQPSLIPARCARGCLGLAITLLLAAAAPAQQVIAPPPQQALVAPILRPATPDTSPLSISFQSFPTGDPIAVGEFKLRPHLLTSYVRADGLPVQSGARVDSNIFTFAPGLLADLGTHWTADYTATAHNYSAPELRNGVDHSVRITGANQAPELGLQLTESYSVSSPLLIETAQQTKQKVWSNALSADHNFGNLLRYQGTVSMTDSETENFISTRDWATEHWVRATVSPRVETGLGLGLGYSDIVAQPNTRYESYRGDLKWLPTDKVNLSIQGGWQHWHLLSTVGQDKWYPVLQATLGWVPFEQTRIAITDSRIVTSSLAGDSVTDNHTWGVSLSQRLLGKLLLNLAYNQASANYSSTTGSTLAARSDDVKSFSSSLAIQLYKYWSVAATYQTTKNDSSQAGYTYDSSQYGLELRANF